MRQERIRDSTKCYVIEVITKCVVESVTGMRKAERGKGLGKADNLLLNISHVRCL